MQSAAELWREPCARQPALVLHAMPVLIVPPVQPMRAACTFGVRRASALRIPFRSRMGTCSANVLVLQLHRRPTENKETWCY